MSHSEEESWTLPRRTFWLKLLIIGLLVISLTGWLRFQQALTDWQTLTQIGVSPGPIYIAVSGALIGAGGLASAVGVWLRSKWFFGFTRGFTLVWQVWSWVDRLWLARSDTALSNWPFALGATVVIVGYIFAALAEEEHGWYEYRRSRNRS